MKWEIEFTDDFELWWNELTEKEQDSVDVCVRLLEECGPRLDYPHSSQIKHSKHRLRELRVQHGGKPYRVIYAFDPRRVAILLIGGNKTGNKKWYDTFVPIAENVYDQHLIELKKEKEGGHG